MAGWGSGAWGDGPWGIGITVLTGVSASGNVGYLTVGDQEGVVGDTAAGAVGTVTNSVTVALTGVGASGLVGFSGALGTPTSGPIPSYRQSAIPGRSHRLKTE